MDGINKFLETDFTEEQMEVIYTYLGNSIHHSRTIEFIENGYDFIENAFKKADANLQKKIRSASLEAEKQKSP